MQINYTGLNMEVTAALKTFTTNKLEKLSRYADKISDIHVTFDVDKLRQIAEAKIMVPGTEIHARSESENMYKTVDILIDKLKRQLDKYKNKLVEHR